MTHREIARRLRAIAGRKPTDIWRELHALAEELERGQDGDVEALVRVTQPPASRTAASRTVLARLGRIIDTTGPGAATVFLAGAWLVVLAGTWTITGGSR